MKLKRVVVLSVLVLISVLGAGLTDLLAESKAGKKAARTGPASKVIEATVTGENFCVGCALKKELGAKSQCSVYGHKHALKVSGAVGADGKKIRRLKGWTLQYLDNDTGQPFIKEHHGETLTLSGKVFTDSRVFEVTGGGATTTPAAKKPDHPKSEHPSGEHPK